MAMNIPSFPIPYSSTPIGNAYAWLSFFSIDLFAGRGRVVYNVNPTSGDWDKSPVGQISVSLGQEIDGGEHYPTLAELMADPEFAAAYNVIGAKLYQHAAERLPVFAGSSQA